MNNVTFVTMFIRPKTAYRSADTYLQEFRKLENTGLPILLFLDTTIKDYTFAPNVHVAPIELDTSWVPESVELPANRNTNKDTLEYYCIQLMKLKCLDIATHLTQSPYLAWIDFAAFHMFNRTEYCIGLLRHIAQSTIPHTKILAPGCWKPGLYDWNSVCWRFCGTFLIGHRDLFKHAYEKQMNIVCAFLPRITWEVNYWAQMEDIFEVYPGDHNEELLRGILRYLN